MNLVHQEETCCRPVGFKGVPLEILYHFGDTFLAVVVVKHKLDVFCFSDVSKQIFGIQTYMAMKGSG